MAIWEHNPSWLQLNNLWISKSFTLNNDDYYAQPLYYEKFSRLTFTKLDIRGGLDVESFKFLVKCPSLRHLMIHGAVMWEEHPHYILSVEETIECAPQVSTIDLSVDFESMGFGFIDMNKLVALKRQTKLQFLHICDIPTAILDPLLVLEFFKKNAVPEIDYFFEFNTRVEDYDADVAEAFYNTIDDGLRAWKLSLGMPPTISSSSFIDLTGKTAVVTGACDGIGKATVILFRQLGASVIAVGRNYCQMKDLFDECQNIKNDGFLHVVSKSFEDNIEKVFTRIDNKFGTKIDILVNIPDTLGYRIIPHTTFEERFGRDKRTALRGHYNIIQKAREYLTVAHGCIINVKTPHRLIAKAEDVTSIAYFKQRIKDAENEFVSAGVRVNSVNSGSSIIVMPHAGDMTENDRKKFIEKSKKTREEQTANSIAFLAYDAAKMINGTTMNINPMNLR